MVPTSTRVRAEVPPSVATSARAVPHWLRAAGPVAAATFGVVVGAGFALATRARHDKPIHNRGAVLAGRLHRDGSGRSGVAWIDAVADDDVVVRLSRSAGLPAPWPDVHGLALRVGDVDVLLSTTGVRPGARHVLRPGLDPGRMTYTSVMPYRGPHGPVLLAAQPVPAVHLPTEPDELADALAVRPLLLTLAWADLRGEWVPFGTLEVGGRADDATDPPVRFDPLRTPPGLTTYRWLAAFREPAYAAARRHHPVDAGTSSTHPTSGSPSTRETRSAA